MCTLSIPPPSTLSVFWWAEFRKYKGGIKLHTLYNVKTSIPSFMLITPAKTHDVNAMDWLHYESGSFYIFDRYVDFFRLYRIDQSEAWFVYVARIICSFAECIQTRLINPQECVLIKLAN